MGEHRLYQSFQRGRASPSQSALGSSSSRSRAGWADNLKHLAGGSADDQTERRYKELAETAPPTFLLYIDQGEELYSPRTEERQRRRFSEILAHSFPDPRLRAFMSMRSDFLGALQADEPSFDARRQIDVPPLREAQLREVVTQPAALLSARFEPETLAAENSQSSHLASKLPSALPRPTGPSYGLRNVLAPHVRSSKPPAVS